MSEVKRRKTPRVREDAMPEASAPSQGWFAKRAPEAALAVLAVIVFLTSLGAVDLWGKREQRASAEAIDTVENDNWLIAYIQCRKRLEKPPLPRWTIASLMAISGRRDEWIVRLPSVLSALGMVGLIYGLGRRLGGRSVGLASSLALTSLTYFVIESRQAGNDVPLAFFTTLALYAAFRRLHGVSPDEPCGLPGDKLGDKRWALGMYAALGMGFLSKGPIILILAVVALVPYLICTKRFKTGMRALWSGWGCLLFLLLALSWPVPVFLNDPKALEIWQLEMGQKAGGAGIKHHRERLLALEWPMMTAPWTLLATWAAVMPFLSRGREARPRVWFPWFWATGNLAMFCLWNVAKPNYFLPCLPGVALLIGMDWVRLTRQARQATGGVAARAFLQLHWVALLVLSIGGPIATAKYAPQFLGAAIVGGFVVGLSAILSAWAWKREADAASLMSMVVGSTAALAIGYTFIAPTFNSTRSHRELAERIERVLPPEAKTVMFFRELDEGLWFYLHGRTLAPVPGSQPRYNKDIDLQDDAKNNKLLWLEAERVARERQILVDWIEKPQHESDFVLVRAKVYDKFQPGIDSLATPVFREKGLDRNELILLRLRESGSVAHKDAGNRK